MDPVVGGMVAAVAAGRLSGWAAGCKMRATSPAAPPGWVFGAAWTALYAAQGAAFVLSPTPLLGLLIVGELLWPFVYCLNADGPKYGVWLITPLLAAALFLLQSPHAVTRGAAAATAGWLVLAQNLGADSL